MFAGPHSGSRFVCCRLAVVPVGGVVGTLFSLSVPRPLPPDRTDVRVRRLVGVDGGFAADRAVRHPPAGVDARGVLRRFAEVVHPG